MMAAKKAQHRITAPHAKYSNSGQLSCSLCGLAIKHESLWGAHVQSKVCLLEAGLLPRDSLRQADDAVPSSHAGSSRQRPETRGGTATSRSRSRALIGQAEKRRRSGRRRRRCRRRRLETSTRRRRGRSTSVRLLCGPESGPSSCAFDVIIGGRG